MLGKFGELEDVSALDRLDLEIIEFLNLLEQLLLFDAEAKHLVIAALVVVAPKKYVLDCEKDILEERCGEILSLVFTDSVLNLFEEVLNLEDHAYTES